MDILIKGEWIKPPSKDDYLDIRLYGTGEVVVNGDLDREAVAIFVPEHGDLIDRDAFIKEHEDGFVEQIMKGGDAIGRRIIPMHDVARALDEAEVVLEATNGHTD